MRWIRAISYEEWMVCRAEAGPTPEISIPEPMDGGCDLKDLTCGGGRET